MQMECIKNIASGDPQANDHSPYKIGSNRTCTLGYPEPRQCTANRHFSPATASFVCQVRLVLPVRDRQARRYKMVENVAW